MSTGGHTPYIFPGSQIQLVNFLRAWTRRGGLIGLTGWVVVGLILLGALTIAGAGLFQLARNLLG